VGLEDEAGTLNRALLVSCACLEEASSEPSGFAICSNVHWRGACRDASARAASRGGNDRRSRDHIPPPRPAWAGAASTRRALRAPPARAAGACPVNPAPDQLLSWDQGLLLFVRDAGRESHVVQQPILS